MRRIKSVTSGANERPLTVVAKDPSFTVDGSVLLTQVMVPAEHLAMGPTGYRLQVIDYDSSDGVLYEAWDGDNKSRTTGLFADPYATRSGQSLLRDPRFHAQNTYAIVMRVLARFEYALGRRVPWSFPSHQLKIAPHAFKDANAFYSRDDEALQFGYFPGRNGTVFSCLSHDVVAHEATHAVIDGLQEQFIRPSTPDQAAFHEALSDIVALLSVFSLPDVVQALLASSSKTSSGRPPIIDAAAVSVPAMRRSMLLGLARQMGEEMSSMRGQPLRQSSLIEPAADLLGSPEYQEPHRRGEVLVAAMLNAFISVLDRRLAALDRSGSGVLDFGRVVEEAAKAADHLLTIAIRALDYCMPVHLTFSDYLSALLTSDAELVGDDSRYGYREQLRLCFADYGIEPASRSAEGEAGLWEPSDVWTGGLNYKKAHFAAMQRDPQEVFRFLWENRGELKLNDEVYTRVLSVRPSIRVSPEGFTLRETVVRYLQLAEVKPSELHRFKIDRPVVDGQRMPAGERVYLQGGGTLVFDQYGRIKYSINSAIDSPHQSERVAYLWERGYFRKKASGRERDFARVHRIRGFDVDRPDESIREAWI